MEQFNIFLGIIILSDLQPYSCREFVPIRVKYLMNRITVRW